jgi:hypothetical protein
LVLFGIVAMAKYGMSFSFDAICIIQLANENVGLSLGDVYSKLWFVLSCDLTVSLYLVITKHITCILLKANQLT